ncbi:MAG: hypothetical protein K6A92_03295 [Lachnospiraceae bacterium]|nr:hypothetical protein [Lachnospiraceae bacterium]
MIPVIATSAVAFSIWLAYRLHKNTKLENKQKESFWERENRANATIMKPIDDLPYVTLPVAELPLIELPDDSTCKEYIGILQTLSVQKILNLSGISNTDLKLTYGAGNLPFLSEYDQNYTVMVRTIQRLAERYADAEHKKEAAALLEFSVSTGVDMPSTYKLLRKLYEEEKALDPSKAAEIDAKLMRLKEAAGLLPDVTRNLVEKVLE